jgi:hypothetical protein
MTSATAQALACVVGAIALTSCSGSDDAATGAQIIAQAKTAMGGVAWDQIRIWHERGQATGPSGEVVEYEHWGDLHTLGTRNRNPSGSSYLVFDGHAGYGCADAGCVSRTVLDPQGMRFGGYLGGFGFFFPDRFPASFDYQGVRTDHAVRYDVVKVTPVGLHPVEIWVDQRTHHVCRLVFAGGSMRTELSDYRQVGGVRVPFVTRESGATMRTSSVQFDPPDEVAFTPPARL